MRLSIFSYQALILFFLFFIFFTVSLNDSLIVESIIADANVVGVIGIMECKYLLTRYAPIYLID